MPVPKKKHSRSRKMSRRSQNERLTAPSLTSCANCKTAKMPHRVCGSCGFYRGRQVIEVPPLE